MSGEIEKFRSMLEDSRKIAFFGGAGVSTASGIPDFRSSQGIFLQESGHMARPEEIISYSFAVKYPEIFFDFYFDKMIYADAEPNDAHRFLAGLEKRGKEISVITQNIDGLHERAGSTKVYDLHGSVQRNHCTKCGRFYRLDELKRDKAGIPRCADDGQIVRPDIVLYEEQLDTEVVKRAIESIKQADMLIVAGTSLAVYPATGLIDYFNGKHMAVINQTPIPVKDSDALVFETAISDVFSKIY